MGGAEELGYHPEVILSGRRINDSMGKFVAENTVKKLIRVGKAVKGAKVLILGLTFKENVGDIRNTKVVDIVSELAEYDVESLIFDPYADAEEVLHEYGEIIRSSHSGDSPHSGDTIPNSSNSGHVPRMLPAMLLPSLDKLPAVDAVVVAVPHDEFKELTLDRLAGFCRKGATPIVIDIKGMFDPETATKQGVRYWRL